MIDEVLYEGPSYNAGLGPGMKITQVGAQPFTLAALNDAVAASTASPVQLTVVNGSETGTYSVDYHGGAKYPHLQKVQNHADVLDEILHPLAP